jgi:hypothetical protein
MEIVIKVIILYTKTIYFIDKDYLFYIDLCVSNYFNNIIIIYNINIFNSYIF